MDELYNGSILAGILTIIGAYVKVVVWPYLKDVYFPQRLVLREREVAALEKIARLAEATHEAIAELRAGQAALATEIAVIKEAVKK